MHDGAPRLQWRPLSNGNADVSSLAGWATQARRYAAARGLTNLERYEYDVLLGQRNAGFAPHHAVDQLIEWREITERNAFHVESERESTDMSNSKMPQLCHVCRTEECDHGVQELCGHWVPWPQEGVHLNTCPVWAARLAANPGLMAEEA